MKLFLTGATGFIGQHIHKKYEDVVPFFRNEDLVSKLYETKPDVIVNCAAEIYNTKQMWDVNVSFVSIILNYLIDKPEVKFIQIGSSSEYGYVNKPSDESDPTKPKDYYSLTKSIASLMCQKFASCYETNVCIIRPYSPFGVGEKTHRLFPRLLQAFKYDRPMELARGVHDFLYIEDFMSAFDTILKSNCDPGEVINVSSGVETSNTEVYKIFKQIAKKEAPVTFVDKFVTYPVWKCDNSHLKFKYNWMPKFSLQTAIEEFYKTDFYE